MSESPSKKSSRSHYPNFSRLQYLTKMDDFAKESPFKQKECNSIIAVLWQCNEFKFFVIPDAVAQWAEFFNSCIALLFKFSSLANLHIAELLK